MSTTSIGQELAILLRREIGVGNYRAAANAGLTITHVLDDMETMTVAQVCDLKMERDGFRVWVSRCGLADGEPFEETVYLEEYNEEDGMWTDLAYFDGDTRLEELG
jgi:hypothetical protein